MRNLPLHKRDTYIKQITKQIHDNRKMIAGKIDELRESKKDNPMLEEIYNDTLNNAKQSKKKVVDALHNLANYLSTVKVSDKDDEKEKKNDIKLVMHEIRKHK